MHAEAASVPCPRREIARRCSLWSAIGVDHVWRRAKTVYNLEIGRGKRVSFSANGTEWGRTQWRKGGRCINRRWFNASSVNDPEAIGCATRRYRRRITNSSTAAPLQRTLDDWVSEYCSVTFPGNTFTTERSVFSFYRNWSLLTLLSCNSRNCGLIRLSIHWQRGYCKYRSNILTCSYTNAMQDEQNVHAAHGKLNDIPFNPIRRVIVKYFQRDERVHVDT